MPENFEIKGFLTGHRAEVVDMCLTEYNEAETMQMFKEEGREEGINEINALNIRLINDNRLDDLRRAATDIEYQAQLLRELFPQNLH